MEEGNKTKTKNGKEKRKGESGHTYAPPDNFVGYFHLSTDIREKKKKGENNPWDGKGTLRKKERNKLTTQHTKK